MPTVPAMAAGPSEPGSPIPMKAATAMLSALAGAGRAGIRMAGKGLVLRMLIAVGARMHRAMAGGAPRVGHRVSQILIHETEPATAKAAAQEAVPTATTIPAATVRILQDAAAIVRRGKITLPRSVDFFGNHDFIA